MFILGRAVGVITGANASATGPINTPSSQLTAAGINTLIEIISAAGGGVIYLPPGVISLSVPLIMRSGVYLVGAGKHLTTLLCGYSVSGSLADSVSNSLVTTAGQVAFNGWATFLTNRWARHSYRIDVTSLNTILVDDYVELIGANLTDEYSSSGGANVIPREIVKVSSIDTHLRLAWRTRIHHKAGVVAREVTPVLNWGISDLTISSNGQPVALGLDVSYSLGVSIERVKLTGFSRADIEIQNGTAEVNIRDCTRSGGSNSFLINSGGHDVTVNGLRCDITGGRFHTSGVKRPMIFLRHDPSRFFMEDCELRNGGLAYMATSGHGTKIRGLRISHMLPDAAYDSIVAAGEYNSGAEAGIFQTVSAPLDQIDVEWSSSYEDITVQECASEKSHASFVSLIFSFYLHDSYDAVVRNIKLLNFGQSSNQIDPPTTDGYNRLGGFFGRDNSGHPVECLSVRGLWNGAVFTGNLGVGLDGFTYEANNGVGEIGAYPFRVLMDTASVPVPQIKNVIISNANERVRGVGSGAASPGPGSILENVTDNFGFYSQIRFAVNKTGDVVKRHEAVLISTAEAEAATGQFQFKAATGAAGEVIAVTCFGESDPNADGNFMAVSLLTSGHRLMVKVRAADTVRPGDKLTVDNTAVGGTAGKYWIKTASPAAGVPYVVATSNKTGTGAPASVGAEVP